MSAHTPGPWKSVFRRDHSCYIRFGNPKQGEHKQFDLGLDDRDPSDVADARLIAAAPELLESVTCGAQADTPEMLEWVADRLVNVYGESPQVDYVLTLRERAKKIRAAIRKATEGA